MFCSNCGSKLPEGARFCSVCGARVADIAEAPVAASKPAEPVFKEETGADAVRKPAEAPAKTKVTFDWSNVIDEPQKKIIPEIKSPWSSTGRVDEKELYAEMKPSTDRSRTMSFIDVLKAEKEQKEKEQAEAAKAAEQVKPADSVNIEYTEVLDPSFYDMVAGKVPAEPKPEIEEAPGLHIAPLYYDLDEPVVTPFDLPEEKKEPEIPQEPRFEEPEFVEPAFDFEEPVFEEPVTEAVEAVEPEPEVPEIKEEIPSPEPEAADVDRHWNDIPDFLKPRTESVAPEVTEEALAPSVEEPVEEAVEEAVAEAPSYHEELLTPTEPVPTPEPVEEAVAEVEPEVPAEDIPVAEETVEPDRDLEAELEDIIRKGRSRSRTTPEPGVITEADIYNNTEDEYLDIDTEHVGREHDEAADIEEEPAEESFEEELFKEMDETPKPTGMTIAAPADRESEIEALKRRLAELMGTTTEELDAAPIEEEPAAEEVEEVIERPVEMDIPAVEEAAEIEIPEVEEEAAFEEPAAEAEIEIPEVEEEAVFEESAAEAEIEIPEVEEAAEEAAPVEEVAEEVYIPEEPVVEEPVMAEAETAEPAEESLEDLYLGITDTMAHAAEEDEVPVLSLEDLVGFEDSEELVEAPTIELPAIEEEVEVEAPVVEEPEIELPAIEEEVEVEAPVVEEPEIELPAIEEEVEVEAPVVEEPEIELPVIEEEVEVEAPVVEEPEIELPVIEEEVEVEAPVVEEPEIELPVVEEEVEVEEPVVEEPEIELPVVEEVVEVEAPAVEEPAVEAAPAEPDHEPTIDEILAAVLRDEAAPAKPAAPVEEPAVEVAAPEEPAPVSIESQLADFVNIPEKVEEVPAAAEEVVEAAAEETVEAAEELEVPEFEEVTERAAAAAEEAAKAEPKQTDALTLEELERDLFGDVSSEQTELEATKKIDKFYTLYRKNEEFQRLLDEEYTKLKAAGGPVPEQAIPEPVEAEPALSKLKKIEDATIYKEFELPKDAIKDEVVVKEMPAEAAADKAEGKAADFAKAAVAAAGVAAVASAEAPEEADYEEVDKGGGFLTVLAVIIAILLVILLAVILILQLAPDSGIALQIDSIIENITSHFTLLEGTDSELLL